MTNPNKLENLKLDSPNDCNFQFDCSYSAKLKDISSLYSSVEKKQDRKKRKIISDTQKQLPSMFKKKPNFFQKMYKETQKKIYISSFIHKIKHLRPSTQNFQHNLLQNKKEQPFKNSMKTFLINSYLQTLFSCFFITVTLLSCIYSTLTLVFPEIETNILYCIFSIVTLICFICQFLFKIFSRSSINVSSQKPNNYLYVRQATHSYFRSGWLIIDGIIIILCSIELFINNIQVNYLKLIVLLKIYPCLVRIQNLQILYIRKSYKQQFWQLVKTFIWNYIFAHFIAITLLIMTDPHESWFIEKQLVDSPWTQKYIWSYYWATTIMYTVGFGDITPVNSKQATVMIFIQSVSCMVLAYNIAKVGKIINKINSYEIQKVNNLKTFTQMQMKQPASQQIQKKITKFIVQSAQMKRNFSIDQQQQLMHKLPKTFYQQLKKQSTWKIFGTIPFFRNLKFSILQQLAIKIDKKLTHPQEIIVQAGTIPGIFILNNGYISYNIHRVGLKSHGKQIQQFRIQADQYKIISMYSFINKPINYDIKCKDYTIMYTISKNQLQNLLNTNPYCYQYYCMFKQKDRLNISDWEINICQLCQNIKHNLFECPKLHYIPLKDIIVAKALYKASTKFRLDCTKRRRRFNRQPICALKYYSQIQSIFKSIRISERAKQFVEFAKKRNLFIQSEYKKSQTLNCNPQKYIFMQGLENPKNSSGSVFLSKIAITDSFTLQQAQLVDKLMYKDSIRLDNLPSLADVECCHRTTLQVQTLMKINYLKQLKNNKQNKNKITFDNIYKQIVSKIMLQVSKNQINTDIANVIGISWIVDLDIAYNYKHYFQNANPQNLKYLNKKTKKINTLKKLWKSQ